MIFRNPYSFSAVNWNWNLEIDWSKHVGTVIHSYLKPMRMNINTALLNSCVSPQTIPDIISSLTVNELQCDSQRGQDSTGPWVGEICSRTRCVERRLGVHLHVCPLWSSFNKDTDPKSQRKCKIKTASCVSSWISLPTGFANYFFEGSSLFSELRIPVLSLPRSQLL